jgi:flagellar hook protein FlgE
VTTGTASGTTSYIVTFNSTGSLNEITDNLGNPVTSPTISITGWSDGAADSTITLSMGTAGGTDGVTQYSSGSSSPAIDVKTMTNDGFAYGRLKSVSIGTDGTVTAKFDNGQSVPIYKIPIATFGNADGLQAESDNVYQESESSGSYTLHQAGTGGAGKIDGSSLESSTTDTSTELSLMIVAQQAYSAASQIISTSKSMFDDLIQAAR